MIVPFELEVFFFLEKNIQSSHDSSFRMKFN